MSIKSKFIIILKHEKARTKSNARSNEGITMIMIIIRCIFIYNYLGIVHVQI